MLNEQDALYGYVLALYEQGMSREQVVAHLLDNGYEESFVKVLMAGSEKLRHAKRRSKGLTLILAGAVLYLFCIALVLIAIFKNDSLPIILYGLAGIGIIIAITGCIKMFYK